MTLAIKRVHNLPPHLSYVSTLPDITKTENLCCLPLNSVSDSELTVSVRSDVPLPFRMHAAVFATGQWLC